MRICIDVDELEKAAAFYTSVAGLKIGRRLPNKWIELVGGPAPIDLLRKKPGTHPVPNASSSRDYARHWTPIHLDFPVDDLEAAITRAEAAGGKRETEIQNQPYGRIVTLADPFGHGFCLLQFTDKGYDAIPGVLGGG